MLVLIYKFIKIKNTNPTLMKNNKPEPITRKINYKNLNNSQKETLLKMAIRDIKNNKFKRVSTAPRLIEHYEKQLIELIDIIDLYKRRGFSNHHLHRLLINGFGISSGGVSLYISVPEYQLELFIRKHLPHHSKNHNNQNIC